MSYTGKENAEALPL